MSKRFQHLGEEWEAFSSGSGHGVAFGFSPPINPWGVIFRSVTNPARGDFVGASISRREPESVPEGELRRALEERLVLDAINRSKFVWRPAEAISKETQIPLERVLEILDDSPSVIAGSRNAQGFWLFTTREHLTGTASASMKQYFEMEESS